MSDSDFFSINECYQRRRTESDTKWLGKALDEIIRLRVRCRELAAQNAKYQRDISVMKQRARYGKARQDAR